MQIEKYANDELTAEISIQISPEDYKEKFQKGLKDYAKKVKMPGFRPGMVPIGMVKKMIGKSLLADELNNITSDAIFNYIQENKIDIIGNPLPKTTEQQDLALDEQRTYTFKYEIAFAPSFDLDLSENIKIDYHRFKADDQYIDDQVKNYRTRLGEPVEVKTSEPGDTLHGAVAAINEDGTINENGYTKEDVSITFNDIEKEADKELFKGLAQGSSVDFEAGSMFENNSVRKSILGEVGLNETLRFTVHKITRISPAEINQEFFDKLFGEGVISTEEEMRQRIADDAEKHYENDSDNRFYNEAVEYLINNTSFNLPEEFLKRWLTSVNRDQVNNKDIIENFDKYARSIRWQIIESKIVKENQITVTEDDVVELFYRDYMNYFGSTVMNEDFEERIRAMAKDSLKNEKEVNKAYDRLYAAKMQQLFKSKFKLNIIEHYGFDSYLEAMQKAINA
jgi:trigger factor